MTNEEMDNLDDDDREFFLKKIVGAEKGDNRDQLALSTFYSGRENTAQNRIAAYMWFKIATYIYPIGSKGYKRLTALVIFKEEELTKNMTQDEIDEAQKIADDWIKINRKMD